MSLSKKTRFNIFKRDHFTCQYCGRSSPTVVLECDHILAVSQGGKNDVSNLITSCFDCNRGKGKEGLDVTYQPIPEMMELEQSRAEQLAAFNRFLRAQKKKKESAFQLVSNRIVAAEDSLRRYFCGICWNMIKGKGYEG